jgi:hypothetical protein
MPPILVILWRTYGTHWAREGSNLLRNYPFLLHFEALNRYCYPHVVLKGNWLMGPGQIQCKGCTVAYIFSRQIVTRSLHRAIWILIVTNDLVLLHFHDCWNIFVISCFLSLLGVWVSHCMCQVVVEVEVVAVTTTTAFLPCPAIELSCALTLNHTFNILKPTCPSVIPVFGMLQMTLAYLLPWLLEFFRSICFLSLLWCVQFHIACVQS